MEHENYAGDKDCCWIIRKCVEELGELAGKLDITISISLRPPPPKKKKKLRHYEGKGF